MAEEGTVRIRGRDVPVREGDLLLVRSNTVWSNLVAPFCDGWGHVVTVALHEGRLMAFSVYIQPCGLVMAPIERFGSPSVSRLAICRPRVPRTRAQTIALRLAVADVIRMHTADARWCYDTPVEFAHSLFRMQPSSSTRYHCAELAARLVRASGAWPTGRTVSLPIHEVAREVGEVERIF